MPATLLNSSLRFQVVFNESTGYFNITDLLQTEYNPTYGMTLANLKELFRISFTAPGLSTTVVYQNAGWAANVFTAPDLNGTTPTWAFNTVALPLDSDGNVLKGTYTFESKVTFGSTVYQTSNTYDYQYESPEVLIEETVDCAASTLTSEDIADYSFGGVTPTVVYAHTITAPTGSGVTAPGTTSAALRIIGGGNTLLTILWNKIWQISFSNTLTYAMLDWGAYPFIVIYDVVTGYKSVDVQCTSNCCNVRQCVVNLTDLWKSYKGVDPVAYERVGKKLMEINVEWMNLEFAQSCGESYDTFCTALVAICASENCSTPAANASSTPIWPILSSTGTVVTPSTFAFTTSAVTKIGTTSGNPGDLHWYTNGSTTLYLQGNVAGVWTALSGNLYVTSTAAPTPATIIYNNSSGTGTSAGTSEEDLDTETITPTDYLTDDGDILHVYTMFQLALNDNGKTLKMYWGGDIITTKFTDSLVNVLNNTVVMEMWITRTSATTQDITTRVERFGEVANTFVTAAKTLANPQIIKITGQNTVAAANDIVGKKLLIEVIKTIPIAP